MHSSAANRSNATQACATLFLTAALTLAWAPAAVAQTPARYDGRFLEAVRAHVDAVLEHGLDRYGRYHSPMFAADLSLETLSLPDGKPPQHPGVVDYEYQRYSWSGSNLYWDILTLRSCYLLTQLTDEPRYRDAADAYLDYFARYAPSPYTGLFPWGQHAYWKMTEESDVLDEPSERWRWFGHVYHEFESFTPPWRELWPKAPGAILNFAQGIHDWHVWDYDSFVFDRHGLLYNRETPGAIPARSHKYPARHPQAWQRHAGLYMYTFAFAHDRTGAEKYLEWTQKLADLYWNMRDPETDETYTCLTWGENLGTVIPEERQTARGIVDEQAYWMMKAYQLVPDHPVGQMLRGRALAYMRAWANAQRPETGAALWTAERPQHFLQGQAFTLAHKLSGDPLFHDWAAAWARAAYDARPHAQADGEWNLSPERYGKMLITLIQLEQITGDAQYLAQAREVAGEATGLLAHDSGLFYAMVHAEREEGAWTIEPYNYYNSHTGAQTLLYALTQLHIRLMDAPIPIEHEY